MLLAIFLIYLIGTAFAVKQNVDYLPGRSGDIIIETTNAASGNSAILLHGSQFQNNDLTSIEDARVADLLAHVMGTQPFNTLANRKDFPKGDIFNKAKAALLVTLDSLSSELISKNVDYQRVDLTTQSFPSNTISIASTLATGTTPSSHGIVADQWKTNGEKVVAFEKASAGALTANIADILSQEWSGASLTVSASASATLAAAFSANKKFAGSNSYGYFLNNGAYESLYKQAASPLSASIRSVLDSTSFSSLLGLKVNGYKVTAGQVTFDLNKQADLALFAELAFAYNMFQALGSDLSSLVGDENPDFFALSFSSLKGIKEAYGEDSASFSAAAAMIASTVEYSVAQMDKLYGNRAVAVIACLNPQSIASDATKAAAYQRAKEYMSQSDFELYYPALYISDAAQASALCAELKYAVENPSTKVHCFSAYNFLNAAFVGNDTDNNTGNHTHKKPLNVPAFWIILWMSVVLVLFILGGIYLLCNAGIEASKDSLLFRSTGRHLHQN